MQVETVPIPMSCTLDIIISSFCNVLLCPVLRLFLGVDLPFSARKNRTNFLLVGFHPERTQLKNIQDPCLDFDLVDIWRVRNAQTKRFTWRE